MTEVVDGHWRIRDDPPIVTHVEVPGGPEALADLFAQYRSTMSQNRRELIERYRFVDFALKVVGVGSVGTRCFMVLLEGRDRNDPLILQIKEATASVLAPYAARAPSRTRASVSSSASASCRRPRTSSWAGPFDGRDYYFRQLWDMKGSLDLSTIDPWGLAHYGRLCARILARAHARSGDAIAIAAYLGGKDTFDGAVADWPRRTRTSTSATTGPTLLRSARVG